MVRPDSATFVLDLVDEWFRREVQDGSLMLRCPEAAEVIENWARMAVQKVHTTEAALEIIENDEVMKRRVSAALDAFMKTDAFRRVVAEYVEATLERLVREGVFSSRTEPDGTVTYDWADNDPDAPPPDDAA